MYPSIAFHFLKDDCLVVPFAVGGIIPRHSWSHSVLIAYSEQPKVAGKKLREVMEAASALVRSPLDMDNSEAYKEWSQRHSDYFHSPLYGSMDLQNKHWTIYCGNDCSPRLGTFLPAVPKDEAAGLAFLELRRELQRLHDNPA
jgi:hypothetical protein